MGSYYYEYARMDYLTPPHLLAVLGVATTQSCQACRSRSGPTCRWRASGGRFDEEEYYSVRNTVERGGAERGGAGGRSPEWDSAGERFSRYSTNTLIA